MPELRWTLLLLGALFIAVLAWTERRKSRQSARSMHEPTIQDPSALRAQREPTLREPILSLPEMRARDSSPSHELPVVRLDALPPISDSASGTTRADTLPPVLSPATSTPPPQGIADEASLIDLRVDGFEDVATPAPSIPEPGVSDLPVLEAADAQLDSIPRSLDGLADTEAPGESREGCGTDPATPQAGEPIVDWPPEEERRIIALRLVSVSPDRFSGRAIRTALAAEGFIHGKFSIFHKTDAQRRALLSAASLSKPGVFDLETIDTQRFSGLNLFAVVSGTQPAREAFERLLACARNLNERLEGGLQDDRGGPLTPSRIAALRESMGAAAAPLS
jgi:hypothetical protein